MRPANPANGSYGTGTFTATQTLTLTCASGYQLFNSATATCEADGQVTGANGTCARKFPSFFFHLCSISHCSSLIVAVSFFFLFFFFLYLNSLKPKRTELSSDKGANDERHNHYAAKHVGENETD